MCHQSQSISTFRTLPNHAGSLMPARTGGGSIALRPLSLLSLEFEATDGASAYGQKTHAASYA